jgi:hypothetical protein
MAADAGRRCLSRDVAADFREVSADLPYFHAMSCHVGTMGGSRTAARSDQPALPAWKAFVVQFSREADGLGGTFSGRVEHLSSGRRARFDSPEELLAVLGTLLDELGGEST